MNQKFYYLIIFIISIFYFLGCSASSTSGRYGKSTTKTERPSSVKFSSEDSLNAEDPYSYLDEEDEEDEFPEEESEIDIAKILAQINKSSENSFDISTERSTTREMMLMEIIKYLNTPYKFGGNSKNGIDCSAFTQTIYNNSLSVLLLRSAREQFTQGLSIEKSSLKFGDLVFFNTRRRVRPGHVGIFIGGNLFAHSSSKQGVIISSLDHEYYSRTYMGARRIRDAFSLLN
jgi:cell wall-associated NlpC family hydrolase